MKMTKKKRAGWMIQALRLVRPLFHGAILGRVFQAAYALRQQTDLIPGIQLAIPVINTTDLTIFAVISIAIFIIVNFVSNVYELSQPLHGYYQRFFR